ncbi:MAG: ATP-binding protein, partial [Alloprevotella sp.]
GEIISLDFFVLDGIIPLDFFVFGEIISLDFFVFGEIISLDFFKCAIFAFKNDEVMYYKRHIDKYLAEWASRESHKPVLLRGARQVGKSTAVRHLGEAFESYVEINLERQPQYKSAFAADLRVQRIVSELSALCGQRIRPGKTLLFIDEIQECPEAIMSLRFFKEDMPEMHVIAAGSLLEFALKELPTFGVGRIHSIFMYPMNFDEFLLANGEQLLLQLRNEAFASATPLSDALHEKLVGLLRTYMLVGGMPECVAKWVESHDYLACQEVQDDILVSYEDDFPKYKNRVDTTLLRQTLRSAVAQATRKFVYSQVGDYKTAEVKRALELLILAGILIPVTCTKANGLPLGSEADESCRKILPLDCGLALRLKNMNLEGTSDLTTQILTSTAAELVNKGTMAELLAGLELLHYKSPHLRHDLFYWVRQAKNAQAEIDYLSVRDMQVLPIEVKAGIQGGMKSLWMFMREKHLQNAVRCSLENFGTFDYVDKEDDFAVRHVQLCPLYALSQL